MYKVVFYENEKGVSELWDFLNDLELDAKTNKYSRIQYKQIIYDIQLLADNGLNFSTKIVKHIEHDIWELRPGFNRILFFSFSNNTFVLLHHFRKKTMKTPKREIIKAKSERDDWICRKR